MAVIQSGGSLVTVAPLSDTEGFTSRWYGTGALNLVGKQSSYAAIYNAQPWVYAVVRKLARAAARLPLKVHERTDTGRPERRESAYAQLLDRPNRKMDRFFFWEWTAATLNVYGESTWRKIRDRDGNVVELWPFHPTRWFIEERDDGDWYALTSHPNVAVHEDDIVHFRDYNPESTKRGMSPLEPLRMTLLNEDAARRSTASFWERGARPGVMLKHPGTLSEPAQNRLKAQWSQNEGADRTGSTVILEEGMEPEIVQLTAEEAQYIQTRKLNREEVCGAFDVPPPVVHILDRATFSNITEQMRSMYRDTMAPRLRQLEDVLDLQLRTEFDPGGSLYAEFKMDEVLRGDFEARAEAYQKGINSGWVTPAEVRAWENLPHVEGSDQLFVNSTLLPIGDAGQNMPERQVRTVLGRLARQKNLDDVDVDWLVEGLNGHAGTVRASYQQAVAEGDDLQDFRDRIRALQD